MKRLPSMSLVVALSATVAACDGDPGAQVVQRDVYSGPHAFENCVADWGNQALCQQRLSAEEQKKLASNVPHAGSSSVFIWGPGYSGADRAVLHNGTTYTPTATRAVQTASYTGGINRPIGSFSAPRPAGVSSGFSSRGGFGATGRGVSGIS